MSARLTVLLTAFVVGLLGGCARQPAGPRKALEQLQDAVLAGEREGFLARFDASARERRTLRLMFGFMRAAVEFDERFRAEYGDEAVGKTYVAPRRDFFSGDRKWLKGVRIKVDADTAVCSKRDWKKDLTMVRRDGQWLIKTDGFEEFSLGQLAAGERALYATTRALRYATKRIGRPGYTPAKIKKAFQQAFLDSTMR